MVTAVREAIDELYIPLTNAANAAEWLPSGVMEERKPVLLEKALAHRRLVQLSYGGWNRVSQLLSA